MDELRLIQKLHFCCDKYVMHSKMQDYRMTLDSLQTFIDTVKRFIGNGTELSEEDSREIIQYLNMIHEAQQCEDWILIADILETLVKPTLSRLVAVKYENRECGSVYKSNFAYNMEKLKQIDKNLYEQLAQCSKTDGYVLEMSGSGYHTCYSFDQKGKYYLCSNVDPYFDGEMLAKKYYRSICETYIIYGLGLGYHCDALARFGGDARIEIYENDLLLIKTAFCANRLDWLWFGGNIKLYYDKDLDMLAKRIGSLSGVSTDTKEIILIHYPSIRHIKNGTIREYMERLFVSDSSVRSQEDYMHANFDTNVKNCRHDVRDIAERFKDKNVVIVAGGPSLNKNIDILRHNREDRIVVAVGTVFRKLTDRGIKPDYVIIADPQLILLKQFDGLMDSDIPLLVLSTACGKITDGYHGEKYLLCQEDYPKAEMLANREGLPLFASGGSVSTTALDFCIRMGSKSIAFIGLDLAFTEGKSHTDGTLHYQQLSTDGQIQQRGYEWIKEEGIERIRYKEVNTSRNLAMYNEWISSRVKKDDVTMPVFDATEGGAVIDGLKIVRLKDL